MYTEDVAAHNIPPHDIVPCVIPLPVLCNCHRLTIHLLVSYNSAHRLRYEASYFLVNLGCFLGGVHRKHAGSTVIAGRLYCVLFISSSMTFGVMLITFWPFQ